MRKKPYEIIVDNFRNFLSARGNIAYQELESFFCSEKTKFYNEKYDLYLRDGIDKEEAIIKARQGWVSVIGRSLEHIIEIMIEDFCSKNNLLMTNDKVLRRSKFEDKKLELLKRLMLVDFGEHSVLPDGDIIIYHPSIDCGNPRIIAILSVKNSFRERYTETPYWKIKLMQSKVTEHIKVFMITPDPDDEISCATKPKKARIVMEHELDGIYLAKETFDKTKKVKDIHMLLLDLQELIQ